MTASKKHLAVIGLMKINKSCNYLSQVEQSPLAVSCNYLLLLLSVVVGGDCIADLAHTCGIRIGNLLMEIHVTLLLQRHKMYMGVRHLKTEHSHTYLAARDSLLHGHSHLLGKHHHLAELLIVDVEDIVSLLLGHNESMTPVHRVDVKEGIELIVLRNLI